MSKGMKMCVNCKYLKDGKYCNRKKSDIYNPKIFCGYWKQKPTVFDLITASPEVLAEKLVYSFFDDRGNEFWTSTLCNHTQWEARAEAFAATVAKLKEVCNG